MNAAAQFADEDSDVIEAAASRSDLVRACRESLDFLASIVLTEIYSYQYPPFFLGLWQLITEAAREVKGKPKYALGIPRGFAKTVFLKLYVVWLVLFTDRKFILIVCNTETHAMNFISDVADFLSNPNIVKIFGDWRAVMGDSDTKTLKKFTFRGRDIMLAGLGAGQSVRGLNIKAVRPDIVIMDDMQSRDEAKNPEIAKELLIWMLGTLMKACHPQRCVFIFVGNMYPFEGSILRKLKHSPDWHSFITGGILADGESLWPEHRSVEDLLAELRNDANMGHPELFYAEVMNDEEGGTVSGIDVSKIPECPVLDSRYAQGGFVLIDPALKRKKSNNTALGAFLVFDGTPILWEVVSDVMDPSKTIEEATKLAMRHNIGLIVVEDVAYQETLAFWMQKIWTFLGVSGLEVGLISTGGLQKNARIGEGVRMLLPNEQTKEPPKTYLHPRVRNLVIYKITQWDPSKQNNSDDELDLLGHCHPVMQRHGDKLTLLLSTDTSDTMSEASNIEELELPF